MELFEDILKRISYPGRGIMVGITPDNRNAVIVYFLTGRSINSRNRVLVSDGDRVSTQPFDPEKMEDLPENDPPADSLLYKGGPVRSPEQAVRAEAVGADYLSAGPVSAGGSGSPVNETDLISPGELRKICEAVKIPVFAEASLRAADVPALSGSGIAGILTPAPRSPE